MKITTFEQNEFDKRVSLLMDCGVMKDKNWPDKEVKKRIRLFLKLWEKTQKDIIYTTSLIMYVQLKEDRKGRQKEVLEVAKQGDINMFTVIKSHENYHAIIDECGEILGYWYRIKPDLLRTLEETTEDLSRTGVNASNQGNYPTATIQFGMITIWNCMRVQNIGRNCWHQKNSMRKMASCLSIYLMGFR